MEGTTKVGERLTLADLFVYVELQPLVQKMCGNPVARTRDHLVRWTNTCGHQGQMERPRQGLFRLR